MSKKKKQIKSSRPTSVPVIVDPNIKIQRQDNTEISVNDKSQGKKTRKRSNKKNFKEHTEHLPFFITNFVFSLWILTRFSNPITMIIDFTSYPLLAIILTTYTSLISSILFFIFWVYRLAYKTKLNRLYNSFFEIILYSYIIMFISLSILKMQMYQYHLLFVVLEGFCIILAIFLVTNKCFLKFKLKNMSQFLYALILIYSISSLMCFTPLVLTDYVLKSTSADIKYIKNTNGTVTIQLNPSTVFKIKGYSLYINNQKIDQSKLCYSPKPLISTIISKNPDNQNNLFISAYFFFFKPPTDYKELVAFDINEDQLKPVNILSMKYNNKVKLLGIVPTQIPVRNIQFFYK